MANLLDAAAALTGPICYSGQPGVSDEVLYTALSPGVILSGVFAANATGSDQTLTLAVRRASGTVEPLVTALHIPAGTAGPVINTALMAHSGIFLRAGDSLHGSCSAASSITVTAHE
jgi:hypothetical protein